MRQLGVVICVLGFAASIAAQSPTIDPRVAALVANVSAERLAADVQALAGFGTRHIYSDTASTTRGIGAAREWIRAEFARASPRLQVAFDTYQVVTQGTEVAARRRVAQRRGGPAWRFASPHLRVWRTTTALRAAPTAAVARQASTGRAPTTTRLGANDDGSGTALVIELARVFAQSDFQFDATLVFVALAGEEQGLVGAKLHAQRAAAEGWRIDAVLNNDIVGNSRGGTGASEGDRVRVFSEGPEDSPSRQIARYVRRVATRYQPGHDVTLVARADRFGRGGDHTAFNQHGFAGVRVTEANEAYQRQHTVADTADGVDPAYLQRNARVNAAALASLALAPPAPVVVNERGAPRLSRGASGHDAALAWTASPGPSATASCGARRGRRIGSMN